MIPEEKSSSINLSRDGIDLKDDMVDFLAAEVKLTMKNLIGVINSVIAHSMIYNLI